MFLNKSKIFNSRLLNWFMIVLLSALVLFSSALLIAAISSFADGEDDIFGVILFLVPTAVFACLLIIPIVNLSICGLANKFNNLFETDADGIVLLEYASRVFRVDEKVLSRKFDKVVSKGFLSNCSLGEHNGQSVFILNNGAKNHEDRYEVVKCPNCGAFSQIRTGFSQSCSFCGGPLKSTNPVANTIKQPQNQFSPYGVASKAYVVPDPGTKANYDIYLKSVGEKKGHIIQLTMQITAMNYQACRGYIESTPIIIQKNVPLDAALTIKRRFEAEGASIELVTSRGI